MRLRRIAIAAAASLVAGTMIGPAYAQDEAQENARQDAQHQAPDDTQALAAEADSLSGAYLAGRVAEGANDLQAAVDYFKRALSFDSDNRAIQQSLMLNLIALGRFGEALPLAAQLKEVPEIERFSRLALAVDAFKQQKYEEAQNWLKLALESDLDRLITGLMTAWAMAGEDDAEGAIAHIDAMSGPDWYGLFTGYHKALIAAHAGLDEVARESFAATVEATPGGGAAPEAYLRLLEAQARFLARKGDSEAALAALQTAEEFVPGRVTIDAVREKVEDGEPLEPLVPGPTAGAAEVLLNLATALNRGGGETFVRLYLQYALALQPQSDAVLIQLAGVAEQQGRAEKAIDYYAQIPEDSPAKHIAELQLGLNLADLDRHEEAIEHLSAAVEEHPDDMRAYLALGGVYASQENYAAAAELYDRAVARMGEPQAEHWNIFYQRGIAYERLKEWEKAEPNFRTALELHPDQPQVLNYLGYSWVDMNINLEEGLELIKRAVELRPSDGYIVDSLGWAYYRLGRFEDAVRELERAVSLMPNDPILNDHLGDAYWRVGRKLEATFQWRHARDLDPDEKVLASVNKKLAEGLPPIEEEEERAAKEEEDELQEASAAGLVPIPDAPAAAPEELPVENAVATGGASSHVVAPGESLWSIAAEQLGDGSRFRELLELNPQLRGDPARIVPGQELVLPAPAE